MYKDHNVLLQKNHITVDATLNATRENANSKDTDAQIHQGEILSLQGHPTELGGEDLLQARVKVFPERQ